MKIAPHGAGKMSRSEKISPLCSAKPKIREPMSLQTPTFITVYSLKKLLIFSEKLFFFL